jgi:hypothetical protein
MALPRARRCATPAARHRSGIDEIAERARNAGMTLKSDPHDTEWKSRVRGQRSERFPPDDLFGDIGRGPERPGETPPT